MTILDAELKAYKPTTVDDTTSNGGRITATQITSAALQNVFAHAFKTERDAGSTKYRKFFWKVANDDDDTLYNPAFYMHGPTAGGDYACFWPGTQRDTQADADDYSGQIYASALLKTNVSAGSNPTVVIDCEIAALTAAFATGLKLVITDKATPDGAGNLETTLTIGTPTVTGTEVSMTTTGTLANSYTVAAGTIVSVIYEPASDTECSVDNWAETCAGSGTYDETTYPVTCDNIGTIEQTWTLTFSSATDFTVSGDVVGSVGAGSTSGDYSPTNSYFSKPYFTLLSAGWAGTWASGDTIVWQTHPAAVPLWFKRVIPASTGSLANNKIISVITGEAA